MGAGWEAESEAGLAHARGDTGGPGPVSLMQTPPCLFTWFLRQHLSVTLESPDSARLLGLQAPGSLSLLSLLKAGPQVPSNTEPDLLCNAGDPGSGSHGCRQAFY